MIRSEHTNRVENDGTPPNDAASAGRLVPRRAVVLAGWTVPAVLALHLPVNAFAQYNGPCVDDPNTPEDECQPF